MVFYPLWPTLIVIFCGAVCVSALPLTAPSISHAYLLELDNYHLSIRVTNPPTPLDSDQYIPTNIALVSDADYWQFQASSANLTTCVLNNVQINISQIRLTPSMVEISLTPQQSYVIFPANLPRLDIELTIECFLFELIKTGPKETMLVDLSISNGITTSEINTLTITPLGRPNFPLITFDTYYQNQEIHTTVTVNSTKSFPKSWKPREQNVRLEYQIQGCLSTIPFIPEYYRDGFVKSNPKQMKQVFSTVSFDTEDPKDRISIHSLEISEAYEAFAIQNTPITQFQIRSKFTCLLPPTIISLVGFVHANPESSSIPVSIKMSNYIQTNLQSVSLISHVWNIDNKLRINLITPYWTQDSESTHQLRASIFHKSSKFVSLKSPMGQCNVYRCQDSCYDATPPQLLDSAPFQLVSDLDASSFEGQIVHGSESHHILLTLNHQSWTPGMNLLIECPTISIKKDWDMWFPIQDEIVLTSREFTAGTPILRQSVLHFTPTEYDPASTSPNIYIIVCVVLSLGLLSVGIGIAFFFLSLLCLSSTPNNIMEPSDELGYTIQVNYEPPHDQKPG
jgi:hypothetical protein